MLSPGLRCILLNAYVERFVLSIKSECLERMIFFSEQSLRRAVAEFIHHYRGERNHQGPEAPGFALTAAGRYAIKVVEMRF